MANPLKVMQETLPLIANRKTLIFGAIYLIFILIITAGIVIVSLIAIFIANELLAVINESLIKLLLIISATGIGMVLLFVIDALVNIFAYTGFSQLINRGTYDLNDIAGNVRARIFSTMFLSIITSVILLLILAIIELPLYLLLGELGIAIGFVVYMLLILLIGPLIYLAVPIVVLERVNAIQALAISVKMGLKNYLFNLASLAIIFALMAIMLIPIIGTYFFIIIVTMYTLKVYEENKARTPII